MAGDGPQSPFSPFQAARDGRNLRKTGPEFAYGPVFSVSIGQGDKEHIGSRVGMSRAGEVSVWKEFMQILESLF